MDGFYQIDVARSGLDNMSIDQAMLQQTAADGVARLRIYQWSEPTVSLGYFQKLADFEKFNDGSNLTVVRRATGGGAIVHHYDWTYSICMSASEVGAGALGASKRLYDCIHQSVILWLNQFGKAAELWSDQPLPDLQTNSAACSAGGCSFLCFERRHAGDVIMDRYKVMGSAQRRLGSAILQHGSLLLSTSPYAKTLMGLSQLSVDVTQQLLGFSRQIRNSLSDDFGISFQCCDNSEPLVPIPEEVKFRFASQAWVARM